MDKNVFHLRCGHVFSHCSWRDNVFHCSVDKRSVSVAGCVDCVSIPPRNGVCSSNDSGWEESRSVSVAGCVDCVSIPPRNGVCSSNDSGWEESRVST
ncbi:unnamed protein product [Heterobilharzia americana]|nr:unnamed protein product [Heterobilharzia americana]